MANFTEYFELYLQNHSLPDCLDLMPEDDSGITFKQRFIDRNCYKEIGSETEELFELHLKIKSQECVNKYKWKIEMFMKNRDDLLTRLINFEDTYSSKKTGTKEGNSEGSNTETTTDIDTLSGKDVVGKSYEEKNERLTLDTSTNDVVESNKDSRSTDTTSTQTKDITEKGNSETNQNSETVTDETNKITDEIKQESNTETDTFYNPIVGAAEGENENIVDAGKQNESKDTSENKTDKHDNDVTMDYNSSTERETDTDETDKVTSNVYDVNIESKDKTSNSAQSVEDSASKSGADDTTTEYGKVDTLNENVVGSDKRSSDESYEDNFESKSNIHKLYSFFKTNPELMKSMQELENIYEEALAYMDILFMGVL